MPTLLDLFCGAGGASAGYYLAGYEIVGVDINPQPNYPFPFARADALEYLAGRGHHYSLIHASPPCQAHSQATKRWGRSKDHPDMIPQTRHLLQKSGRPYVIENVVGAPLINPILLCGSMFGLKVRRHRLFECSFSFVRPPCGCKHAEQGPVITVTGHPGGKSTRDGLRGRGNTQDWRDAMRIQWMSGKELAQAIPPDYTHHIGRQIWRQFN
jgi:DNA (cytosine-5)-methyltransferase 1